VAATSIFQGSGGAEARGARVVALPAMRPPFTAYLGMVVFLASWTMMFAGLLFGYGLVRSRAPVWPPLDQPPLPLLLPGLNTAVAAGSSAALLVALRSFRGGRARTGARALALAAALGAAFLALQARVWAALWADGLHLDTGPYASAFYALTGFHALHVLVGVASLAWLAARAARRAYGPDHHLPVRLWSMYWHFVGAVWLVIYLAVYVA